MDESEGQNGRESKVKKKKKDLEKGHGDKVGEKEGETKKKDRKEEIG